MANRDFEIPRIQSDWRDTAREINVLGINGYFVFPVLVFMLHIAWITFGLLVFVIAGMVILDWRGMSPRIFMFYIRSRIAGKIVRRRYYIGNKQINK